LHNQRITCMAFDCHVVKPLLSKLKKSMILFRNIQAFVSIQVIRWLCNLRSEVKNHSNILYPNIWNYVVQLHCGLIRFRTLEIYNYYLRGNSLSKFEISRLIDWLIERCSTPTLVVFKLYRGVRYQGPYES
jgi:hypothetical protein